MVLTDHKNQNVNLRMLHCDERIMYLCCSRIGELMTLSVVDVFVRRADTAHFHVQLLWLQTKKLLPFWFQEHLDVSLQCLLLSLAVLLSTFFFFLESGSELKHELRSFSFNFFKNANYRYTFQNSPFLSRPVLFTSQLEY